MSNLIERLRDRYSKHSQELRDEAADEIERLRDVLEDIASYTGRSWAKDKAIKALGWDYE